MKAIKYSNIKFLYILLLPAFLSAGCKKLIEVDQPQGKLTTQKVFSTNEQALSAMAGVYTKLMNGTTPGSGSYVYNSYASGFVSMICAFSANELGYTRSESVAWYNFYTSRLSKEVNSSATNTIWASAYECLYGVNSMLEGISASTSTALTASYRTQLSGEAKFLRAFTNFYLVNLFGDIPLVLTTNFNLTRTLSRSSVEKVYELIKNDLSDAIEWLPVEYPSTASKRTRPNKNVAKALLARVALYTKDYVTAARLSGELIAQSGTYSLEADLNNVFLKGSKEVIWQLEHNSMASPHGSATPEAASIMPNPVASGNGFYFITNDMLNAFDPADQRKIKWTTTNTYTNGGSVRVTQLPFKYKTSLENMVLGGDPSEFNTAFRLAEQFLIRAEALLLGPSADKVGALEDVNAVRRRAGFNSGLPNSLNNDQVMDAIMHERQVELFCEWGHRWLDLKRTGKAVSVLSTVAIKQPWAGDYQLLYPIPVNETVVNPNLKQNPRY